MERALTASSFSTPINACFDHHAVVHHHRDVAVPHREVAGQQRVGE